jgi:hypothetical protein
VFGAGNGFEVHGESSNDIMHIFLGSQPEINVVTTRRAALKWKHDELLHEAVDVPEEAPSNPENAEDDSGSSSVPELRNEAAPTSSPVSSPTQPLGCTPRNL